MPTLNRNHIDAVIKVVNQGPFFQHLSMSITDLGVGYSHVVLDLQNQHLNPFGGVHGGVYASVIDTATYWAVYCQCDEDAGLISIDLKIDYLSAVNNGRLKIKGRSIKVGKTMCLAEAFAADEEGKWIAHGTSKIMVRNDLQTISDALTFMEGKNLPPKFI